MLEMYISSNNASSLTSMIKSIYSCKNILKRGKKRELIKKYW